MNYLAKWCASFAALVRVAVNCFFPREFGHSNGHNFTHARQHTGIHMFHLLGITSPVVRFFFLLDNAADFPDNALTYTCTGKFVCVSVNFSCLKIVYNASFKTAPCQWSEAPLFDSFIHKLHTNSCNANCCRAIMHANYSATFLSYIRCNPWYAVACLRCYDE